MRHTGSGNQFIGGIAPEIDSGKALTDAQVNGPKMDSVYDLAQLGVRQIQTDPPETGL